ncbi:MAG TPA: transcription antitermination factor NusB [Polyangiaceae bacterium]|nr:transcription antitermination factor NusB [Polyangiaceae bacterium]
MTDAREVAVAVLTRVFDDDAYAAAALARALDESRLEARDRGLCTELVYGVLRTEGHLLSRLRKFGKLRENDRLVLGHLLVGAYQLEFLDRVPPRAAVHVAVEHVRKVRGKAVGGFVNAVLRRVTEAVAAQRTPLEVAIWQSAPAWLRGRLTNALGEEDARLLLTDVREPAPTLRLRAGRAAPSWFAEEAAPIAGVEGAYRYVGGGDPRRHPEFEDGTFAVQELGAQLVAEALGVQAGMRVLDVCAGRGHKTALLAERVGASGRVVATDLHEHKVADLRGEFARFGLAVEARPWDWTQPPPDEWRGAFDRVLVDAPCSGVGTLRRRPEILRRLRAEDPVRLATLQATLLGNAALALAPGGRLVFATCSVLPEEGERVLEAMARSLVPAPFGPGPFSATFPAEQAVQRLLPRLHGSDGYFVASLASRPAAG